MKGYGGKILRVNLSTGELREQATDEKLIREYLGGRGFGAKILWDEVPAGADPLGADNKLIVAAGPLAGLYVPGAGRASFIAKSPATGGYGDSSVGGRLGPELRHAGFDAIVITGCAPSPVYLYIDDDRVEIRGAETHWGKGCIEAEKALKNELGTDFQVAVIGPAGENLVRFAGVNHDFGRQAARTGMGAVMGSKLLKAICVRGTKAIGVADCQELLKVGRQMYEEREANGLVGWQEYGTSATVALANEIGALPTHNFRQGVFEKAKTISHEEMKSRVTKGNRACFACPLACGKFSYSTKYDVHVDGPEYETTALLGSNCGLDDIEDVLYANYLCDDLGMDTISAGNAVGFLLECYARGIVSPEEMSGFKPEFGNPEAVFELLELIARQEGIGKLLSQGVKKAAAALGRDSTDYAMHIKGLEISGYESRGFMGMLLAYMTCDVGATHTKAWMIPEDLELGPKETGKEKVQAVINKQHRDPLFDCLGVCQFQANSMELYAKALKAATGLEFTAEELLKVSERVWNLTRLYWKREYPEFDRTWDLPPRRYAKEALTEGPVKDSYVSTEEQNKLLDTYYELRGWDKNGLPTKEKLQELGLLEALSNNFAEIPA